MSIFFAVSNSASTPIGIVAFLFECPKGKLIKVGFPIFSLAYVESIASTIDKVWLIKFSDLTNLGLYSFGLYAITMVVSLL